MILGIVDHNKILHQYVLRKDIFIIYGSVSASYIPLTIMWILFGMPIQLLRKQYKLCDPNQIRDNGYRAVEPRLSRSEGKNCNMCRESRIDNTNPQVAAYQRSPSKKEQSPLDQRYNDLNDNEAKSVTRTFSAPAELHSIRRQISNSGSHNSSVEKKDSVNTSELFKILFLSFVVCWAPFFIESILTVLCKSCIFDRYLEINNLHCIQQDVSGHHSQTVKVSVPGYSETNEN
ncbi:5HT2B-like protein [Mya arenaria]|uniref:5HT2B-like protein n=1 Tax=Mya arenaria TaxID=6604 RepID=A0ABY7G5Z7_MYAAR|nr:5HT2B-like protein [Mya arenaria]